MRKLLSSFLILAVLAGTVLAADTMSISGERTSVRMIIMKDCCTFVTSVVRRVIRDAVEK